MTDQLADRVHRLELEVTDISLEQKELSENQAQIEALVSNHLKSVAELSAEVHRLAVAVERSEQRHDDRGWEPDRYPEIRLPSLPPDGGRSWHQQLREKRISLSPLSATGWSTILYAVIELVRAIADGRIRFH